MSYRIVAIVWMLLGWIGAAPTLADEAPPGEGRLIELGAGDSLSIHVYGQPDMDSNSVIGDDGTVSLPLVGAVHVAGMSPMEAARALETQLEQRKMLVNAHVSVVLLQSRSQVVSVIGAIRSPGRYVIDARTQVIDLLAQAGGVTENGADYVYLIRSDEHGTSERSVIDLKGMRDMSNALPTQRLRGGDEIVVPEADRFFIKGEVAKPDMYRLEPGMTVNQAIARAGGVTPRGSDRRVEILRAVKDGVSNRLHAHADDVLHADDVIQVKERIF